MEKRKNYIERLLPEVLQISDPKLRKGVIETWEKAMRIGGWKNVEDLPFTLLIPDVPVSLINHVRIVTKMCLALTQAIEAVHEFRVNRDYLLTGALLHDVGKLIEYNRKGVEVVKSEKGGLIRHPFSGAWLALECGLPYEVAHVIATHSYEGNSVKRSDEAIIVCYCDSLHFQLMRNKHSK